MIRKVTAVVAHIFHGVLTVSYRYTTLRDTAIEGDTERILMRAMMRKIDEADPLHESPLGSQNISVVEVGAHAQIFDHFIEFTGLKTLIITDIDSAKVTPRKDGEYTLTACRVTDGTHSTNGAIKHFLQLAPSGANDPGHLKALLERDPASKQLTKQSGTWAVDSTTPSLFIAYQTTEKNYEARSYEDAFIHLNRDFIIENLNNFRGLKNREQFSDLMKDAYDLANHCVSKKTHFALDVIYSGTGKGSSWTTPGYIIEGLKWLRDA